MKDAPQPEAFYGLKVDQRGNLYASAEGKHIGMIEAPELPANMVWGDDDGKTLYLTARTGPYRIRLKLPGIRP